MAALLILAATLAGPPTPLPIDAWIRDLTSDNFATWKAASEHLWRAGERAVPALKKAARHIDPDVQLRARVVLSRLEWGLLATTPPAIVAEIERYRDGDAAQRLAAVTALVKQGAAGYTALNLLLRRETNEAARASLAAQLKLLIRPAARLHAAKGELADAERLLETAARSGGDEAMRDLACFWLLTGKAAKMAKAAEDPRLSAYTYRALGDLKSARAAADGILDKAVLAGVLREMEDYPALAKLALPLLKSAQARASLLMRAGDRDGFEKALTAVPEAQYWTRAGLLFYNGRPREGIEALHKGAPSVAVTLLTLQGRWREALKVEPPANAEQRVIFRHTQAVAAHMLGDIKKRDELLAHPDAGIAFAAERAPFDYNLLGSRLEAGRLIGRRADAVADVGKWLDKLKPTQLSNGNGLWREVSSADFEALGLWWECLRSQRPDEAPSVTFALLDGWFHGRKPDKDFDAIFQKAKEWRPPEDAKLALHTRMPRWKAALRLACLRVGKLDMAEKLFAADNMGQGDLLFARKRWADAATAYTLALEADPANAAALYLCGVCLKRAGNKAGDGLILRARLAPLADEAARYDLAMKLGRMGLLDEAAAERLVMTRVGVPGSVFTSNAASARGEWAARRGKHAEAAYLYRRMLTNLSLSGSITFIDPRANLFIPGWAHQEQALAHIADGKPDKALTEARQMWLYLPEDRSLVVPLVRAFEKADKADDAKRLFDEQFDLCEKACVDTPDHAERHNRLAWMAARCRRRLDPALVHAKRGVALNPKSAGAHDTLAEVHFQRGEKDEALAAIKKAEGLAPKRAYFAAQRKRIEAGDPKAELPAER
jgi:tetratricopeptide (TPR) repeat protein